jgi:hypothetical protein
MVCIQVFLVVMLFSMIIHFQVLRSAYAKESLTLEKLW